MQKLRDKYGFQPKKDKQRLHGKLSSKYFNKESNENSKGQDSSEEKTKIELFEISGIQKLS